MPRIFYLLTILLTINDVLFNSRMPNDYKIKCFAIEDGNISVVSSCICNGNEQ